MLKKILFLLTIAACVQAQCDPSNGLCAGCSDLYNKSISYFNPPYVWEFQHTPTSAWLADACGIAGTDSTFGFWVYNKSSCTQWATASNTNLLFNWSENFTDCAWAFNATMSGAVPIPGVSDVGEVLCPAYSTYNRSILETDCYCWSGEGWYNPCIGGEFVFQYMNLSAEFFSGTTITTTTTVTTTATTSTLPAGPYAIKYSVSNFNTFQPVENVQIVAINDSIILSNVTDAYGEAELSAATAAYYLVSFSRSGYETKNIGRWFNGSSSEDIFMNPQSTAGIIRLYFHDSTLFSHSNCFYFSDNGRLLTPNGCFLPNETGFQTIHTFTNYDLRSSASQIERVGTMGGMREFFYGNIYFFIGAFFIGSMISIILGAVAFLFFFIALGRWRKK